jgi:hypothetical protein
MLVAKKKRYGSINLLKGIQGSKLATLIVVLVILFAIPLTVTMSRQQQQTKQEASIGIGGGISIGISGCGLRSPAGGKCITDTYPSYPKCRASGGVVVANCSTTTVCCVPSGVDSCRVGNYGHCQYTDVYCRSGTWVSNASHRCPGPSNYKCCKK